MNFHDIADACDIECFRGDMKMTEDGARRPMFVRPLIGLLVQKLTFRREFVLGPNLLVMNQRTLARAVKPVLEGGDGDGICHES